MRFRKKPVEVEAVQIRAVDCNFALEPEEWFDGCPFSEVPPWLNDALASGDVTPHTTGSTDYAQWHIKTLEGVMNAQPGSWIIRGIKGELYPCEGSIFEATYEPVEEDGSK